MQMFSFDPEFQLGDIPGTNPVLPGIRRKTWHHAIGGELATVPEDSWATTVQEVAGVSLWS